MSEIGKEFIPASELGKSPKQPENEREARIEEIVRTEAQNYLHNAYKMVERPLQEHQMDRVRSKVRQADTEFVRASGVLFEVQTWGNALPEVSKILGDEKNEYFESLNAVSNRISDFANPGVDAKPSYNFPDQVESLNRTTRELFKILHEDFSFSHVGQEATEALTKAFIHRVQEVFRDEFRDSERKKFGETENKSVSLDKNELKALHKGFYEFLLKKRPNVSEKIMEYLSKKNTDTSCSLEKFITAQDIIEFFDLVDLGEVVVPQEVSRWQKIRNTIDAFFLALEAKGDAKPFQDDLTVASKKVRRFGDPGYVASQVFGPHIPLPELAAQKRALFMPNLNGPRARDFNEARKLVESRDVVEQYNDTMNLYLSEVKVAPQDPRVENAWMVHEVTQLIMATEAAFHDLYVNLDQELKKKMNQQMIDEPKARLQTRQYAIQSALKELVHMQKTGYDQGLRDLESRLQDAINVRTLENYFSNIQTVNPSNPDTVQFTKTSRALAQFREQINEMAKKATEIGEKVRERNKKVRELALRYFGETHGGVEEITAAEVQSELESLGMDGEINPAVLSRLRQPNDSELSLDDLLASQHGTSSAATSGSAGS